MKGNIKPCLILAVPQHTPSNLHAVLVLSDAISLRWSFAEHDPDNMLYYSFKVLYHPINHNAERVLTVEGHNKRSCFLSGLRPKTAYQLRVMAFSAEGDGQASLPVTVATLDGGK